MSGFMVGQVGGGGGLGGTLGGAPEMRTRDADAGFARLLEAAEHAEARGTRAADKGATDESRAAAEELVASTLVQPLLAKMRETNTAAAPFAPGHWEKTFGPFMDAEISTRIVRASGWDLVDRLAEGFARKPSPAQESPDGNR